MAKTVHLTRHQIMDARRAAVRKAGLSPPFLYRKQYEYGTRAVAGWLEDHNFYDLARDWVSWAWLLAEDDERRNPTTLSTQEDDMKYLQEQLKDISRLVDALNVIPDQEPESGLVGVGYGSLEILDENGELMGWAQRSAGEVWWFESAS